jgi:hypothetical protein
MNISWLCTTKSIDAGGPAILRSRRTYAQKIPPDNQKKELTEEEEEEKKSGHT